MVGRVSSTRKWQAAFSVTGTRAALVGGFGWLGCARGRQKQALQRAHAGPILRRSGRTPGFCKALVALRLPCTVF